MNIKQDFKVEYQKYKEDGGKGTFEYWKKGVEEINELNRLYDWLTKDGVIVTIPVNSNENLYAYRTIVERDINSREQKVKILCSGKRFFEQERKSWLEIIDNSKVSRVYFELALTKPEEFKKDYLEKSRMVDPNKKIDIIAIDEPYHNSLVMTENNIWFQTSHLFRGIEEPPVFRLKRGHSSAQGLENLLISDYDYKTKDKKRSRLEINKKEGKIYRSFEQVV